jgi:hypothetical protein
MDRGGCYSSRCGGAQCHPLWKVLDSHKKPERSAKASGSFSNDESLRRQLAAGENIAEDGLGRVRRRDVDEVQSDTISDIFGRTADRTGRRIADEAAGAFNHRRLTAASIGKQRRAAGSIGSICPFTGSKRRRGTPRRRRRRLIDRLARRQAQHERKQQNSKL